MNEVCLYLNIHTVCVCVCKCCTLCIFAAFAYLTKKYSKIQTRTRTRAGIRIRIHKILSHLSETFVFIRYTATKTPRRGRRRRLWYARTGWRKMLHSLQLHLHLHLPPPPLPLLLTPSPSPSLSLSPFLFLTVCYLNAPPYGYSSFRSVDRLLHGCWAWRWHVAWGLCKKAKEVATATAPLTGSCGTHSGAKKC